MCKATEAFRQVLSLIEDFGMQEQQKDAEAASICSDSGLQPSSSMWLSFIDSHFRRWKRWGIRAAQNKKICEVGTRSQIIIQAWYYRKNHNLINSLTSHCTSADSNQCSIIHWRFERFAFDGGSSSLDWNRSAVRSVSTSASNVCIRSSKARFSFWETNIHEERRF